MSKEIEQNLSSLKNVKEQLKANVLAELIVAIPVVGLVALFELLILPNVSGTFGTILTVVFAIILFIGALILLASLSSSIKYIVPEELKKAKKISVCSQILIVVLCVATSVGMFFLNDYIYSVGYRSGDNSQIACYDCGEPADGGYWKGSEKSENEYFCQEHFEFHKEALERVKQESACKDAFGHDWAVAYTIAEDTVEAQLKAPSSAKFSNKNDTSISVHNNVWIVKGWVEAQNSFGATIRNTYTVQITFTSADKYTVDFCRIN